MQETIKRLDVAAKVSLVMLHVVRFNIGNQRHHGLQMQERSVALVRFHHQILPFTQRRVGARLIEQPPDYKSRILPRLTKNGGDQASGGGLAVGSRNRDAEAVTHELCQHFRSRHNGDPLLARRQSFGVVLRYRS